MFRSRLRQLSAEERVFNRYLMHWNRSGQRLNCCAFPEGKKLLSFTTDSGWCGVIDPLVWLNHVQPDYAGLAPQALRDDEIVALFLAMPQPLSLSPDELAYQRIVTASWLKETEKSSRKWPVVAAPQGFIWLTALPAWQGQGQGQAAPLLRGNLPVRLNFELGESQFHSPGLHQLTCGDVLLVNRLTHWVTSQGKKLGIFHSSGEDMTIEAYDESLHQPEAGEEDVEVDWQQTTLQGRSAIPIKLTFLLEQRVVSFDECEQLLNGGVIPCTPGAEESITVLANGMAVAKGALIWLDDRMGVEINTLNDGSGHG